MKNIVHEWGPWEPKYNIFGELMPHARRSCVRPGDACYQSQEERIPSLGELEAMTRKERHARR